MNERIDWNRPVVTETAGKGASPVHKLIYQIPDDVQHLSPFNGPLTTPGNGIPDKFRNVVVSSCRIGLHSDRVLFVSDCGDVYKQEFRLTNERRSGTKWVNIYDDGSVSHWHDSRKNADDTAMPGRVACVEVKWTEGDGL